MIDAHAHIFPGIKGRIRGGVVQDVGYGQVVAGGDCIRVFDCPSEKTKHSAEDLIGLMDQAGVSKAVLFQGPFYGECNDFSADAVQRHPTRFSALAYADPWAENRGMLWKAALETKCFSGIKMEFSDTTGLCGFHPGARLDEPRLKTLWRELEENQMVLALDLGAVGSFSYQTEAVAQIAREYPGLKILIPHLAQPTSLVLNDNDRRGLWLEQLALGKLPNVYFDTSALPHKFVEEGDPYPSIRACMKIAIDLIGPDKLLWGTDIPGLLTAATYPRLVELVGEHFDFLSVSDREKVTSGNASKLYFSHH